MTAKQKQIWRIAELPEKDEMEQLKKRKASLSIGKACKWQSEKKHPRQHSTISDNVRAGEIPKLLKRTKSWRGKNVQEKKQQISYGLKRTNNHTHTHPNQSQVTQEQQQQHCQRLRNFCSITNSQLPSHNLLWSILPNHYEY